jgi:hypothetical protein
MLTKSATEYLTKQAFLGAALKGVTGFAKSLGTGAKALKPLVEAVPKAVTRSRNQAQSLSQTGTRVMNSVKGAYRGLDPAAQVGVRNLGLTAGIGAAGLAGYAAAPKSTLPKVPTYSLPRPKMYLA